MPCILDDMFDLGDMQPVQALPVISELFPALVTVYFIPGITHCHAMDLDSAFPVQPYRKYPLYPDGLEELTEWHDNCSATYAAVFFQIPMLLLSHIHVVCFGMCT